MTDPRQQPAALLQPPASPPDASPDQPPPPQQTERRRASDAEAVDHLATIRQRLDQGELRMGNIESSLQDAKAALAENTAVTQRVETNTAGLVELQNDLTSLMRLVRTAARVLRPLGWIAAAMAAFAGLWTAIKTGLHPDITPK
jgi:hypothetical protein